MEELDQLFSFSPEFQSLKNGHKLQCEGFGQRMKENIVDCSGVSE